ncbi:hypothetical protein HMPREF0201_04325 [Cedecea davisae DSM 4568]|uniref:Uncharacterized protein n=1 Tax=Cedecea davisae DSM 4568 TaxID=566551 RepID=S3IZR4_9ENTR|nr:hypothetical protein HMPREF0201_04325 [Cedecea davisae DSM 4568]
MYANAHTFDFAAQLLAAHAVKLFGHQHWGKFDNVGFHAEVFQRACGFQAQQAAADYRAAFAAACAGLDSVKIFDGAVNETVLGFRTFNRRDPRIGAGRHDQLVVIHRAAGIGVDNLFLAVDGNGAFANQHFHAVFFVIAVADQREFFSSMMGEIRREMHAVIGFAWLFTKYGDIELVGLGFIK